MTQPAPAERRIFTVSDLTRLIKKTLTDKIQYVWIQGEVSKPLVARSGHLYFDLKDEEALIRCKMWRPNVERLGFAVEHGQEIVAYGELDVYLPRGEYSITCLSIEPLGAGALQLRFEQLKKRLEAEGLYAPEHKKPLPMLPATIAVVTSPDAAAWRDIAKTIYTRHPRAHVLLYPVKVQGAGAAEEIAAAIHTLNLARPDVDVIIAGRGGGSLEDLWAFNEEVVARAIYASRIPVISAVGHETDVTIADFVADVRAKTPTEAGMMVVPDVRELTARLSDLGDGLALTLRNRVKFDRKRLDGLRTHYGLRRLPDHVVELSRRLDESVKDLAAALSKRTVEARRRLDRCAGRLKAPSLIDRRVLAKLARALDQAASARLRRDLESVKSAAKRLESLSPLGVLGRGFSITQDAQGRIVKDASKLREGDRIVTRFHKGSAESDVTKVD